MKISADQKHPDYHEVVHFIDAILINGVRTNQCVHVDTAKNEATVITQPVKPVNGMVPTHVVRGEIEILWRQFVKSDNGLVGNGSERLFLSLKRNWDMREAPADEDCGAKP